MVRRGAFTCVGWQVTPCDPIWQVTSRSSEMGFPWRAISAFTLFTFMYNVIIVNPNSLRPYHITLGPAAGLKMLAPPLAVSAACRQAGAQLYGEWEWDSQGTYGRENLRMTSIHHQLVHWTDWSGLHSHTAVIGRRITPPIAPYR